MAIPFWKVRRELLRLGHQLRDLPSDLANYAFATRAYDRSLAAEVKRFPGDLPFSHRAAIVVIFPVNGLQPSHLRTLDYLREKGYAALVVSNLPLAEAERAQFLQRSWALLERPNFGYDFGGYRDGVLAIADQLPDLERLILLNDSTWFPLPGARDWLKDAEALDTDLAAAASHFGVPRPDIDNFQSITWKYAANKRDFHYGSFALLFRKSIIQDPDFLSYWRRLRLADKKKQTVRRGEIGLTQWVLSRGFSHAATLDISTLDHDLQVLETAQLLHIARNLVIPELPRLQAIVKRVTSDPSSPREDLINLILLAVARQGASYALAPYSIQFCGFPFLKKSPVWLSNESAEITLQLLASIGGANELLTEAHRLKDERAAQRSTEGKAYES